MAKLQYKYNGVVYTVDGLKKLFDLSKSGAERRLRVVIKKERPPASLLYPKNHTNDKSFAGFPDRNPDDIRDRLQSFSEKTRNQDKYIEKYYASLPGE